MRVYEAKVEFVPTLWEVGTERLITPDAVYGYLRDVLELFPHQETFWVVLLTTRHNPIARQMISLGTATSTLASPAEVFRTAIVAGASRIAGAHSHPSGDPSPSAADVQVTRQLREAARILSIDLVDHVVLGRAELDPLGKGFYSFRNAGLL
jgi:DNA repair protein RadC